MAKPAKIYLTADANGTGYAVEKVVTFCNDADVTLPDTYEGVPITTIASNAFSSNQEQKSYGFIILGKHVHTIEEWAFESCRASGILLPSSVASIRPNAFYNAVADIFTGHKSPPVGWDLEAVFDSVHVGVHFADEWIYPDGSEYSVERENAVRKKKTAEDFDIEDGVLVAYYGHDACVKIPFGVKKIGDWAFENATEVIKVYIPRSVESIGSYAFFGCTSLSYIRIPYNVAEIGDGVFDQCTSLETVVFQSQCPSIGGFSHCCSLKNVYIGCRIKEFKIRSGAFSYCTDLEAIDLTSITHIESMAFQGCSSLSEITLPTCIQSVAQRAFAMCDLSLLRVPNGFSLENITIPTGCRIERY